MRTQVGIVGAGPAGLMLGRLLDLHGIDSVILENRSREHVIDRVRAGVLEPGTVDLLTESGVGERLSRNALRHDGLYLNINGMRHRIDLSALAGKSITVWGQNEVVKDLIDARVQSGTPLFFEVGDVTIHDLLSSTPRIRFGDRELACDFIAGCDGFHGVCRPSIPAGAARVYERLYPYAWLGILAQAAPSSEELVYSSHERGFALFSMRSPQVTRLYLQCAPDEDLSAWPDDRIWAELETRLGAADGWRPREGPILQKGVTGMRSFVQEPMRYGRLFLAGDAAHIVPPTGAKGLNLAMADVRALALALAEFYRSGRQQALDEYSSTRLRRVWMAQRFSSWMTALLHRPPFEDDFDHRRRIAELDYLTSSRAAMTTLAENYVGLPMS